VKSSQPPTASTKEAMTVSTKEPVQISRKSMSEGKKVLNSKKVTKKRPTLKELQEMEYSFLDLDLSGILDDLLENKIIELPKQKPLEEAKRTNDLKYYHYHIVISHF